MVVVMMPCCRLCKLFTSPITEVKDLAADFLFVLCKENGKSVTVLMILLCHFITCCDVVVATETSSS